MRFAELVGRLNPKAQSYELGFGGIPTMTNQDIAGALAIAEQQTGRNSTQIFLMRANPRMVDIDYESLLRAELAKEYAKQREPVIDCDLRAEICGVYGDIEGAKNAARDRKKLAANLWPSGSNADRYSCLIAAVVHEFVSPGLCMVCNGRAEFRQESLSVECKACNKTGKAYMNDDVRAQNMGIGYSPFYRTWRAPYKWLIEYMEDCFMAVNRAGSRALWGSQDEAA